MFSFEPLLTSSQAAATARRRSPFETILGAIPIPGIFVPPAVQTEAYLEARYFEQLYTEAAPYSEPVYGETIYQQFQYSGIETTI